MSASKNKKNSTKTLWFAIALNQTVTHICVLRKLKVLTNYNVPYAKHGFVSIAEKSGMGFKSHVSKWWTISYKAGLRKTKTMFQCVQCAALALRKIEDATTWHAPFVNMNFAGLVVIAQAQKTTTFKPVVVMDVVSEWWMKLLYLILESLGSRKSPNQCVKELLGCYLKYFFQWILVVGIFFFVVSGDPIENEAFW